MAKITITFMDLHEGSCYASVVSDPPEAKQVTDKKLGELTSAQQYLHGCLMYLKKYQQLNDLLSDLPKDYKGDAIYVKPTGRDGEVYH